MTRKRKKTSPKVRRPLSELVEALRRHVSLLRDYTRKALEQGDEAYLGEAVGKLRLLVGERGNTPLLLQLMKTLDLTVTFVLSGPPSKRPQPEPSGGDTVTLRQYLGLLAYAIRTPSGRLARLTNADLIHIWAQQHRAAHEDWGLDEDFIVARDSEWFIGGRPVLAAHLRVLTRTVFHVSDRVLAQATPALIEAAENRRRRT